MPQIVLDKIFSGKKIFFAGKYSNASVSDSWVVEFAGGSRVYKLDESVDYVVFENNIVQATVKQCQQFNKKNGTNIQVMLRSDFLNLVHLPTADDCAQLLTREFDQDLWSQVSSGLRGAGKIHPVYSVQMSGVVLGKSDFNGVHLFNSDLRAVELSSRSSFGRLTGCVFNDAKMSGTQFHDIADCTFENVQLDNASFDRISNTSFKGSNLQSIQISSPMSSEHCSQVSFQNCQMQNANMKYATLVKVNFDGAKLVGASFVKAKLVEASLKAADLANADLTEATLCKANLSHANFRGSVLRGADLSGATVDGADFTNAILTGANFTGVDGTKAIGLGGASPAPPPEPIVAGSKMQELERAAYKTDKLKCLLAVNTGKLMQVMLQYSGMYNGRHLIFLRITPEGGNNDTALQSPHASFTEGMAKAVQLLSGGSLQLNTIAVKATGGSLDNKELKALVIQAWCEAFNIQAPDENELKAQSRKEAQALKSEKAAEQKKLLDLLRQGEPGIMQWNNTPAAMILQSNPFTKCELKDLDLCNWDLRRLNLDFRGSIFSNSRLANAKLPGSDFRKCNFANANLEKANLFGVRFDEADLTGALLSEAELSHASFHKSVLRNANLRSADLCGADLTGADLTGADLTDCNLYPGAKFDETTVFPQGFLRFGTLTWVGAGADPRLLAKAAEIRAAGALALPDFISKVRERFDQERFKKAIQMLKAESFQLFSDVSDCSVTGIVKSQSDAELAYACRLSDDGSFACCTQNLFPCGGLHGSMCKHLLVLIIGLAQSQLIDTAKTLGWIITTGGRNPQLDKDAMTAIFLRYEGAQVGEIDWRPCETIPEDFYAF